MKIGYAADPIKRLGGLQTGSPAKLELVGAYRFYRSDFAKLVERRVHDTLKKRGHRLHGEWFQERIRRARLLIMHEADRLGAPLHWVEPDGTFKADKLKKLPKSATSDVMWWSFKTVRG